MSESNPDGKTVTVDAKRAQYERMTLVVCKNGVVNVRNDSYGDDADSHIHSVQTEDGEPVKCSCCQWQYRSPEGGCKHMRKVGQSPIVTASAKASASTYQVPATDGGEVTEDNESPDVTWHRERPEVGGALYARCEECGAESVVDARGDTGILHDAQCSHATPAVDPYPEAEEVNDTPL
jgi:nitrite reductase/ring-hydroxylating ferredoxin subunit